MHRSQSHRGPDAEGFVIGEDGSWGMAHNRLSIIDLSESGRQPMQTKDGRLTVILNGEIYNYLELRRELESEFTFRTKTDTEVVLAAFEKWGPKSLDKFIGMFAFVLFDSLDKSVFAARDRFGVKPLYYHHTADGTLLVSSEIKALHAAGVPRSPDRRSWANYLRFGTADSSEDTFWEGVKSLPAGHFMRWRSGKLRIEKWYDLADAAAGDFDSRNDADVEEEYLALLRESVNLRFRSDVTVGFNLSGGLDSSTLLGLVHELHEDHDSISAYTFATGDERYDETKWVSQMTDKTRHRLIVSELRADEVPKLAASVQRFQDEPYGGVPTIAYAKLFAAARENGTIVLLDGNGMDEQWAGYDYYQSRTGEASVVQGALDSPVRPECLDLEFCELATHDESVDKFPDRLRNLQYRDIYKTKIPRAMRYNDRISMRSSTELREPFLDHRLFELAFRQPVERKIKDGVGKSFLRLIAGRLLPEGIVQAPKRPLQTPQREWLRGPLANWAEEQIDRGMKGFAAGWLDRKAVSEQWNDYLRGRSDNSYYVWQWISLGLMAGDQE